MTIALIGLIWGLLLIGFALTPKRHDAVVYMRGLPGTVVPAGIRFGGHHGVEYVSMLDAVVGLEGIVALRVIRRPMTMKRMTVP